MANDYFKFRQFTVHQGRCAMKVGTDGTLLGAWARASLGTTRILDIGTGTGLIALMMAQRFPQAEVVGIDIDTDAVNQASENVLLSPFKDRIRILQMDIREMTGVLFDTIVSNPPFFVDALTCPDNQRTLARHTVNLTYDELMQAAYSLMTLDGRFSVIIPTDYEKQLDTAARLAGFFISRICDIKTTPNKNPKRRLIEFTKMPVNKIDKREEVLEIYPNQRSPWYQQITDEFYLK